MYFPANFKNHKLIASLTFGNCSNVLLYQFQMQQCVCQTWQYSWSTAFN